MFSSSVLAVTHHPQVRRLVTNSASRRLVGRFVAGDDLATAMDPIRTLVERDLLVTVDHLGEDVTDAADAMATREAYVALLDRLDDLGLAHAVEVSVKLSAVGQALPGDGGRIALDHAAAICAAAARAGTTVTLDMEDHTTVDSTLEILGTLRREHPWVGAVLQSALRRTEADAADLARAGSRVRLVKGAYAEPASVAHTAKAEVDEAYLRCLRILISGPGYPMVATHDLRMVEAARAMAVVHGRSADDHEYQMLYGIRTTEQDRIAASGDRMRVYLPYGADWYGYFTRRLAERPANLAFFLRSLLSR
ncbi:proline dehydrogenase family protein [Pseudonocardia charpentierae]|uniref:proline dehydrogenase n=1 Tax=Pseudonocardia charpentierae TaxID=3075545 RepID=A0ABU2N6L5_9PSEU|nr:proline dehydrogenase family protein [Pseudonocardia sp. DSM 45834]MDT0349578.1 proline dehydrogenase family protein [Pseudonocardia sp. DSM 45834]